MFRTAPAPAGAVEQEFVSRIFVPFAGRPEILGSEVEWTRRSEVQVTETSLRIDGQRSLSIFDRFSSSRETLRSEESGDPGATQPLEFVFSFAEPVAFELTGVFSNFEEGQSSITLAQLPHTPEAAGARLDDAIATPVRLAGGSPFDSFFRSVEFGGRNFRAETGRDRLALTEEIRVAVEETEGIDSFTFLRDFEGEATSIDPDDPPLLTGTLDAGTYGIFVTTSPGLDGGFGSADETATFRFAASVLGDAGSDPDAGEPTVVPTPTAAAAGLLGLLTITRRRRGC